MEDELLEKAMKAMCWDPNLDIPMANAENNSIRKDIGRLFEEKTQLFELQQQTEDRLSKLRQHSKNAEISINQNLKLLLAHQSEVKTELHLYKVAEREHSKLTHEIKRVKKDTEQYKVYMSNTEKELCKRKHAIDDLTNRIKWAKTVLIEWREAMEVGNKGTLLIERYFKEDELLARQKDQRRQALLSEIAKHRAELVQLYDEQKTLEQNLECTANLYRTVHQERRNMVETWKTAVKHMLQRETAIEDSEAELEDLHFAAKEKDHERRRFDNRLTDIITNNRDIEAAIEELNGSTSEIKAQIQVLSDMIILKLNDVDLLQKDLQNLTTSVQNQRLENRKYQKQKKEKLEELKNFGEVLKKLLERLQRMEDKNLSAQQRLQMLEELTDAEDKTQNRIIKEKTRVNGVMYRTQQQLGDLKSEIKVLEIETEGLSVTVLAVDRKTKNIEKEVKRLVEILYELSFKCLEFERRIIMLRGGVLDPELEAQHQAYLADLEVQYAKVLKRLQATEAQNKKLDDNMRKLTDVYNDDLKKLEYIAFKIKEAQVYCEGGVKRLKSEQHSNQLKIVDLSILKMRAHEFENEIASCENSMFNLEKHRLHLNRTIKDRMVEIKSQLDLLNLKRKHLNEERSTLLADIGERNKHIEVVRARFELTSKLLGVNEDGSLVTATQLKVEAAQEKELLLDEGNVLNDRVLKAEEDVKAMENTLMVLNLSNEKFRNNLNRKTDEKEKLEELKTAQTNYCESLNVLRTLRNQLFKLEQDNEKAVKVCADLEGRLEAVTSKSLENSEILRRLQKDLDDQRGKLQRAERELKTAFRAAKNRGLDAEFLTAFERDLDLRELEYRNCSALNQLADMADNDDDIGPKIVRIMAEKGLKMPHQLQKTRSFASWRSEVSSMSTTSRDYQLSTSRSSNSDVSQTTLQPSVQTLNFPE